MEPGGHPNFELHNFANPTELATTAARRLLERLDERTKTATPFCLAISGGRISGDFFQAVAASDRAKTGSFNGVHFFWADERCVPADHLDSNFRLASESMLKPLGIPRAQIHRIRGETLPENAAIEAETELRRVCTNTAAGKPIFDLVLLGMGEDGHIASLFPPAPSRIESNEPVFRAVVASKPPPRRITLTYQTLANAKDIWVLVAGAGKEAAFQNSIQAGGETPLARLLSIRNSSAPLKIFKL